MIADEITHQIESFIGFEPTADQHRAACVCADFLLDNSTRSLLLLTGSAGTGKTSLAAALVKTLAHFKQKVCLMAPTGRAAKVFATSSGHAAFTIHRKIYRQKSFAGLDSAFNLNDNLHKDTLFIVDEASMIANDGFGGGTFGSGRLLDDLIAYVYNGNNCRLLLLGDAAQLPPVGQETSPALDADALESHHLKIYQATLNEVLRQSTESGILHNATCIRQMILQDTAGELPVIRLRAFADITVLTGDELIESLQTSYHDVGIDETMVVTRSNARAKTYNLGIRARVLDREDELCAGDMLLVAKNNYYWTERARAPLAFIANGDRAEVRRVRNIRTLYGLRFADVQLRFPDYEHSMPYAPTHLPSQKSRTNSFSKVFATIMPTCPSKPNACAVCVPMRISTLCKLNMPMPARATKRKAGNGRTFT